MWSPRANHAIAPAPFLLNHLDGWERCLTMRVVSTTSEEEIRRRDALDQLKRDLRAFAANFLRFVSKSGRSQDLLGQMERVCSAIHRYSEAHDGKTPPTKIVHSILDEQSALIEHRPWIEDAREIDGAHRAAEEESVRAEAISDIIRAGMRMTASNLVDQLTQHSVAEDEFYSALRRLDDIRSRRRKGLKKPLDL
jgi:hypothetical protein